MLSNQKAVSRERVIGISFIDILIQAIFLLFVALTIGYEDPVIIANIREYESFGKDLCNKINKGSLNECKEVIEPIIDKEKGKSSLAFCLKPLSDDRPTMSARTVVISPTEVKFLGFTPEYFSYLEKNNDTERLNIAKRISPGIYDINSIINTFGFMREKNCSHRLPVRTTEGKLDQKDLQEIFKRLYQLETIAK